MTKKTNALLLRYDISTLWFNKCIKNKTKSNYLQLEYVINKELRIKNLNILRVKFRETLATVWVYNQNNEKNLKKQEFDRKKLYNNERNFRTYLERYKLKNTFRNDIRKLQKETNAKYTKILKQVRKRVTQYNNKVRKVMARRNKYPLPKRRRRKASLRIYRYLIKNYTKCHSKKKQVIRVDVKRREFFKRSKIKTNIQRVQIERSVYLLNKNKTKKKVNPKLKRTQVKNNSLIKIQKKSLKKNNKIANTNLNRNKYPIINKEAKLIFYRYMIQKKVKRETKKVAFGYSTLKKRYYLTKVNGKRKRICFKDMLKKIRQNVIFKKLSESSAIEKMCTTRTNLKTLNYHMINKKKNHRLKKKKDVKRYTKKGTVTKCYRLKKEKKIMRRYHYIGNKIAKNTKHLKLIYKRNKISRLLFRIWNYKQNIQKKFLSLKSKTKKINLKQVNINKILILQINMMNIFWKNTKKDKLHDKQVRKIASLVAIKLLKLNIELILNIKIQRELFLEINHINIMSNTFINNNKIINKYKIKKHNLIFTILTISTIYKVAQLISTYIASQLEKIDKHYRVLRNFTDFLEKIHRLEQIYLQGLRIHITGKLGGKMRKKKYSYKKGSTKLQKLSTNVSYSMALSYSKFGIISVKIWLINEN